jgi:hypothetical protein
MLLSLLFAASVVATPADSLSARDLLDVATATVADLSDDGRWIALTTSRRRDALGIVAARDGDPSYLRVVPVELYAVDARTLERRAVFAGKRPVRAMTWSPDGTRLAYLEVVDDRSRIVVWERATGRSTVSRLAPGAYVAENSELRWNGAGTQLLFALRTESWRTQVQERFATIVRGPVTHLGSPEQEPFLPWEALRRESARREIATWTPATQRVETLIPEGMIGAWSVSPDGAVRVWNDDITKKTDYETIMGRTERVVARVGADTATRVILPTLRNLTVQWAEDPRRYFFAREGGVWMGRIADGAASGAVSAAADTARRRILAPDSIPASDTSAAARDRRARTRWTLVRTAALGDAVIASRRDGLYLVDTLGATTRIAELPDSTDTASPRASVLQWSHDGRYVYLALNARDRWDRGVSRWDRATGRTESLARDGRFRTALQISRRTGRPIRTSPTPRSRPRAASPRRTRSSRARRLRAARPQPARSRARSSSVTSTPTARRSGACSTIRPAARGPRPRSSWCTRPSSTTPSTPSRTCSRRVATRW